ncbi:MAG: pentapeptide repeat-containing protein [Alistipes sp.]|jgi:hypothetical protein|nr:pentapeptide repeat-containing protein [Alistipes sp.]
MKNKKVLWIVLGLALLCLLCYALIPTTPWCVGIERKDAVTSLITLGGVIAVVFGLFQTNKRITQQDKLLEGQEQQRRDARFAASVELLGNLHESTRIGGAYSLYFLARDFKEYRTAVCEILCAHLRGIADKDKFPVGDDFKMTAETKKNYPKNEVQAIIDLLFRKKYSTELFEEEQKNLSDVFLCQVSFMATHGRSTVINKLNFNNANISDVSFMGAEFSAANFSQTRLNKVSFSYLNLNLFSKFNSVVFMQSVLREVVFDNCIFCNDFPTNFCFEGTPLEGYSYEEITTPGRSLELTTPKA